MRRRTFLGSAASLTVAGANVRPAAAQSGATTVRTGRSALVLSGGGSRGAYQAGVIDARRRALGLTDGQPLPYDMICGTSIGALNSYLVATAQYTRLRQLWAEVPQRDVATIRAPYDKIRRESSGIGTRLAAALKLGRGFVTDVQGLLDPQGVWSMLASTVDPTDPVHLPLYVAATNLTRGRSEIFNREATTPAGVEKQRLNHAILSGYTQGVIRTATNGNLREALFASAAIPLAFPPVMIEPVEPGPAEAFVDGGVTENVPISIARRCCETLHVVVVDPPAPTVEFGSRSMVQIGFGTFQTMQRTILEYQVRTAFLDTAFPVSVAVIRPAAELPGTFVQFNNAQNLERAWQRGYEDGSRGFLPYDPSSQPTS